MTEHEGDAPFNMAMMFYIRLNELLSAKDKALIAGDMRGYYSGLEAIFNNIYFKIRDVDTDKETPVKDIEDGLKKALNILSGALPSDASLRSATISMNFWEVREILLGIDRTLTSLMDRKKMIFPRIESGGLEGFKKRLGLGGEQAG